MAVLDTWGFTLSAAVGEADEGLTQGASATMTVFASPKFITQAAVSIANVGLDPDGAFGDVEAFIDLVNIPGAGDLRLNTTTVRWTVNSVTFVLNVMADIAFFKGNATILVSTIG